MSKSNNQSQEVAKYSSKTHWSFSLGSFLDQFYVSSFTVRVIFYYENELFLSIILIGIAYASYGFWNMINDPLLGWLSDKVTLFNNKMGRRFPWFLIGAIIMNFVYILIFFVPVTEQLSMFIWLLVTICLFETCYSLWQVNWLALYPDKFRSHKERTKIGATSTICAQLGSITGIIIPPLFISYGNISSYITAALVVSVVGFIFVFLIIPGMREDKELISRQMRAIEAQKEDKESYFQVLKTAVKQKNFMSYIFFYMFYYTVPLLLLSSLPFWVLYVVDSTNPNLETLLAGMFLLGAALGVPLWLKMGRKYGNRKAYLYGSISTFFIFVPLFFVSELIITLVVLFFLGFSYGSMWTLLYPGFSDVMDEIVIKTGKRKEGAYTGIRTFVGRLAFVFQAVVFAIIHQVTHYEPGASTQDPLALFGIRFIMAGVPMICFAACTLLIAFVNDLTLEKVNENKMILSNMKL
ncbi:MAG: MFS transporter [Candidatus Lokiarchaeota archaeon]|nr:MFS transporter [Candidatus Lokiarchaeota archaeon]MBD3339247.1 MFS transporter [Candidatus Lokiarchaeota archaeon]